MLDLTKCSERKLFIKTDLVNFFCEGLHPDRWINRADKVVAAQGDSRTQPGQEGHLRSVGSIH